MNDCIRARRSWESSDSCFYFVEDGFGTHAYVEQDKLERLRSMRAKINWKLKKQRRSFYRDFTELIVGWLGELPNLREIFRGVEIDWLLQEAVRNREKTQHNYRGRLFIRFVARSQYKHVPWLDSQGRPELRRTTALHRIDPSSTMCDAVRDLFQIYDRRDLNYVDSHGYKHFHVACRFNCHIEVKHFLELGQDPNQLVPRTGDSPLHLAYHGVEEVDQRNYESAVLLLRRGDTDPDVANAEGSTPMQIIFKNNEMSKATTFFKNCRTIKIDDRDGMGRTPLQWAVANLNPRMVDLVLDHGADLSNFVFPTESYFARGKRGVSSFDNRLHCAMQAIEVVRRLERKGYEMSLSDALSIMEFITELRLFEVTRGRREHWKDDEDFARRAKRIQIIPGLSLHDLIHLPLDEAAQRLTYVDYLRFAQSHRYWTLTERKSCALHLFEILSRRFSWDWAMECIMMMRQDLPLLCCYVILDYLTSNDLMNMCLTLKGRIQKNSWLSLFS